MKVAHATTQSPYAREAQENLHTGGRSGLLLYEADKASSLQKG